MRRRTAPKTKKTSKNCKKINLPADAKFLLYQWVHRKLFQNILKQWGRGRTQEQVKLVEKSNTSHLQKIFFQKIIFT